MSGRSPERDGSPNSLVVPETMVVVEAETTRPPRSGLGGRACSGHQDRETVASQLGLRAVAAVCGLRGSDFIADQNIRGVVRYRSRRGVTRATPTSWTFRLRFRVRSHNRPHLVVPHNPTRPTHIINLGIPDLTTLTDLVTKGMTKVKSHEEAR